MQEEAVREYRQQQLALKSQKESEAKKVQAQVPTPGREEMREFFGPSSSSSAHPSTDSDLPTLPTSHWPPPAPSTIPSVSKTNTATARESEDDVSARWSALVEQAEQRASRMGVGKVDLWGSSDELSEEEAVSESEEELYEEGETQPETPTTLEPSSTQLTAASPLSPSTNSPPPPTSSMLYRLGLGTSSLSLAEGRPPLGRQSSSNAKATAKGVLGKVQEWIRNGTGYDLEEKEGQTRWYIEVSGLLVEGRRR